MVSIFGKIKKYFQKGNKEHRERVESRKVTKEYEIHFQEAVDPVDKYEWDKETKKKNKV
jgi:hypothetical protein